MDFSTIDRSLLSLSRRHPPLPQDIIDVSTTLSSLVASNDTDSTTYINDILRLLSYDQRWESLAVGLCLSIDVLERRTSREGGVYAEGPRIPQTSTAGVSITGVSSPPPFASLLSPAIVSLLEALPCILTNNIEHDEPRVRSLVAKAVGAYASFSTSLSFSTQPDLHSAMKHAQSKRREIHAAILSSLKHHLETDFRQPQGEVNISKATDGALDDTTGWRALETNLHALAGYIDGCVSPGTYLAEEAGLFECKEWFLSGLEYCSVRHVNRHVRAAAAAVLGVIVTMCMRCGAYDKLLEGPLRETVKESLKATLADNWSQVRMAGSVLCRTFVDALLIIYREDGKEENDQELTIFESAVGDLVPLLLPRMCLNRFYLAQGVKLYSQDTWRLIFTGKPVDNGGGEEEFNLMSSENTRGGGGMGAVARNAAPLCRYYSKMCDADNHAVREAACQGVAELAQKLGKHPLYAEYLSSYVTMLLQALLMCFHDESWPVRDEACLACGTFCLAYAEECSPELPTLFERWSEQLTDQIWSVREDAAVALGDAIAAYGPEMLEKVLDLLRKKLPAAKDQTPMSREEYKRLQNDVSAHTGTQLYSCGSLAPKLRKGGAGRIGCSSCALDRPKAPWEATDGCVYLIRELCTRFANMDVTERDDIILGDDILLRIMTELADVGRLSHYPQCDELRTTLWRQLPPIARALGKKRFKAVYLELFIGLLAKNIDDRFSSASQLSIHAAGQCAEELADLIGHGVFRGRLDEVGGAEAFDRVMEDRKKEQISQASMGRFVGAKQFSPFGPTVAGMVR